MPLGSARRGGWRQLLARRRGGRLRLRALQRFFTLLFSTPCYLLAQVRRIYIYIYIYENAHATPPHLDVILHLGSSGGMHGSLQFFAFGLRSLFSSVECFPTHPPIHSCFLDNFGGFSVHFRSSWLAWAPLWTHPAPDLLKCWKLSEK